MKIDKVEIETLLEDLSIYNLIDVYENFSDNTPLVLFIKGEELSDDDETYLKHAKPEKGNARFTYIIALRPNEEGIDLVKKICQVRNERIWICPLLPTVKNQVANKKIVNIPAIALNDIQDTSSYQEFKSIVYFKDYYTPVFELVAELLSSNVNPSMIFSIVNQEIRREDFEYINDLTKRLLRESSVPINRKALIPYKEKYIWIDALAYYIFVNESVECLLLEMQKFYFSFLIDTYYWKDTLEQSEYRYDIVASVLDQNDRKKWIFFKKDDSFIE